MEYYIKINEEKRGPYSLNELAERKLDATTLVMPTDGVEWVPANQIEELRTLFESKDSINKTEKTEEIPFVEARPIIPTAQQEAVQQPQPAPKKKSHTGCLIGILLTLVVLVAVMVVTCPKTEQHKEVIDNAVKTVSNAFAGKVIETAVDNLVTVDNYVVCSLGKVHYDGKDHIVSLGVFGHIFTVDEDDLREAAEQYYKKDEINMKEQLQKKAQTMLQENIIAPATSAICSINLNRL